MVTVGLYAYCGYANIVRFQARFKAFFYGKWILYVYIGAIRVAKHAHSRAPLYIELTREVRRQKEKAR